MEEERSHSDEQVPARVTPAHLLPDERRITAAHFRAELWAGPLPSPEALRQYNEIIPDGAARVFAAMEKQVAHRIDIEKVAVSGRVDIEKRGQVFAFVLGLGSLALGAIAMVTGHSIEGFGVFFVGVAALTGAFFYGTKSQKAERIEKAELMARLQDDAEHTP